jgi:alkaline phosphatase
LSDESNIVPTEAPNELPVYDWHPSVLARANASAEHCARLLLQHVTSSPAESERTLMDWINQELVIRRLGIPDALEMELSALATNPGAALVIFSKMISQRARIGWSTHGHSAVDVNVYSSGGPGTEKIRGNVENTDIGKFLAEYLGVDVDEITKELEKKMPVKGVSSAEKIQQQVSVEEQELWRLGQQVGGEWDKMFGM